MIIVILLSGCSNASEKKEVESQKPNSRNLSFMIVNQISKMIVRTSIRPFFYKY